MLGVHLMTLTWLLVYWCVHPPPTQRTDSFFLPTHYRPVCCFHPWQGIRSWSLLWFSSPIIVSAASSLHCWPCLFLYHVESAVDYCDSMPNWDRWATPFYPYSACATTPMFALRNFHGFIVVVGYCLPQWTDYVFPCRSLNSCLAACMQWFCPRTALE